MVLPTSMCPRYPGISLPSAECVISCTIDGYTPCPSIAGSAVQVAPSMPGFTWLYSGQASTVVTSARNASRAAAGSGSRTTSCSKDIASLPHISASNQERRAWRRR